MKIFNLTIHTWDTVISIKAQADEFTLPLSTLEKELREYTTLIDDLFSTFNPNSLISKINSNEITLEEGLKNSASFEELYLLAKEANITTKGLFNFNLPRGLDFNAIVKGYAAEKMAEIIERNSLNLSTALVSAGGDCTVINNTSKAIEVGLTDPDDNSKIYQIISLESKGIATSGTYIRGAHIVSTHTPFLSASVWGPSPALADAYATAALLSKDLNLSWLPKEYRYSIITQPNSKIIYQSPR
jgi:thiamine biosynthesis lipoprotein